MIATDGSLLARYRFLPTFLAEKQPCSSIPLRPVNLSPMPCVLAFGMRIASSANRRRIERLWMNWRKPAADDRCRVLKTLSPFVAKRRRNGHAKRSEAGHSQHGFVGHGFWRL